MSTQLVIEVDESAGRAKLTTGELFLGSGYTLSMIDYDGTAITGCVACFYLEDEKCIALSDASGIGFNTDAIPDSVHRSGEDRSVKLYVCRDDSIIAQGVEVLRWTPALTVIGGKMIDTRGEKGQTGDTGGDGKDGRDGKDGINGRDGRDGVDGANGVDGTNLTQVSHFGVNLRTEETKKSLFAPCLAITN